MKLSKLLVSLISTTSMVALFSAQADAQITTDGSTPTTCNGGACNGSTGNVNIDGGVIAGANQFHSFADFNIGTSGSAIFGYSGAVSIDNIIARVTGGNMSEIDGVLGSSVFGADLFFVNPNGVVFNDNASLDVSGSVYIATADEIVFANSDTFDARSPTSSFSSASPEAFGFLDQANGAISMDGSTLVLEGGDLVFAGGDISHARSDSFGPDSVVGVVDGNLALYAAGAGQSAFNFLDFESNQRGGGSISLNGFGARLVNLSTGAAHFSDHLLYLSGDSFLIRGPDIISSTIGGERGADIFLDVANFEASFISNIQSQSLGSGRGGDIVIHADTFNLFGGENAITNVAISTGNSGDISLNIANEANIIGQIIASSPSESVDAGGAGSISIIGEETATLDVAGDIAVEMNGGDAQRTAGDINISGFGDFNFRGVAQIATVGSGSTQELIGNAIISGSINPSGANGEANVGSVMIDVGNLTVEGQPEISTNHFGSGDAGDVIIRADRISGEGLVAHASSNNRTDFSKLQVSADSIVLDGVVFGNAVGLDPQNLIEIFVQSELKLTSDSVSTVLRNFSDVPEQTGGIVIQGNGDSTLEVSGAAIAAIVDADVSSENGVSITGFDTVLIENGTDIFAPGLSTDVSGANIIIEADQLEIRSGSTIGDSNLFGSRGFLIGLPAIEESSEGTPGRLFIRANSLVIDGGNLLTETFGTGDATRIELIIADSLIMANGASISSSTLSAGNAGSISISSGILTVDSSSILSRSIGEGVAGSIELDTVGAINILSKSEISSASEISDAGAITINAGGQIDLASGSSITTSSVGADAGSITVNVGRDQFIVLSESEITTNGAPTGDATAGSITIGSKAGEGSLGGTILIESTIAALDNAPADIAQGLLSIDRNSALFVDQSSTIAVSGTVSTPDAEIADDQEDLNQDFLDAGNVLASQCAVQEGGESSALSFNANLGLKTDRALPPSPLRGPQLYSDPERQTTNDQNAQLSPFETTRCG